MNNAFVISRALILTSVLLFANYGFSQRFESFFDSLTVYSLDNRSVNYDVSEFNSEGYRLKLVVVTEDNGNSLRCGGDEFEVKRIREICFSVPELALPGKLNESFEKIGERYLILTTRYHDPTPTSMEHFVDVVSYYERVTD